MGATINFGPPEGPAVVTKVARVKKGLKFTLFADYGTFTAEYVTRPFRDDESMPVVAVLEASDAD